jgi:hypothetical protein
MEALNSIFQKLGIDTTNGLYYTDDAKWKSEIFPSRVKKFLEKTNPEAFFCLDNKPLILFFDNPKDKDLHKKIWNFNEVPVVITIDNGSVEILNGFHLLETGEQKGLLSKLGNQKLTDFSYFELVTGKTWENYQNELNNKNRVDYKLLSNINDAREQIIGFFPETQNEERKKIYSRITNALLGKVIFVRYLIDRHARIYFDGKSKERTNKEFCEILGKQEDARRFFDTLADEKVGFNGDLFPLTDDNYGQIPKKAYETLINLLESKEIATGQMSLFDLYDFSIIPVEFISNVYEYFIGAENQAKQGAYYTPLFLVDYILSETIEKHINQQDTYDCKVLDPACGSGVFLVETLRKLIEQYNLNPAADREQFKEDIKNIAKNNIYGIDEDESAVQVSIFSIYLTLLDYMDPPEIEGFHFPNLLNTNFFCSDFFNEDAPFNALFKADNFTFDFIVGNPPWSRGKDEKKKTKHEPLYVQYIANRKKCEPKTDKPIEIGNKEIAQAFLLRSSDFSATNTKCALIVTSKVLYNLQSRDFREYFLHNYFIERVFELAPVRREVFDKPVISKRQNGKAVKLKQAIAPACVLFFNYADGKNTDTNAIEHITLKPSRFFSMFKIFSIHRHDIKTVQQDRLKRDNVWLWKTLAYGSYLDFNFIKRLKENYPTIQEIISEDENYLVGQGVMVVNTDNGDKNDASDLVGLPYLDTKTDIRQFWINPNNNKKWELPQVHRPRNKELYKAPSLLITEGVNNELKSVAAVCYQDSVYKSSLTGVHSKTNDADILRQFAGLLNSTFFSYYNLMTFSSSCIEREQSHDTEKWTIPFSANNNFSSIVENIENLLKQKFQSTIEEPEITQNIKDKYIELDNSIYNAFSMTKEEKCLLDYTNKTIIPLQMQHDGFERLLLPCKIEDEILIDYANLYINRFASNFEKTGNKFVVEIWHTNQIVGMFFTVVSDSKYKESIIWMDKQNEIGDVFKTIIDLGITKITDQLFIQKDIRGFEKEYFYIFKPNEKRLWHKAVGYLDVNEFEDAILRAGRG